VNVCLMCRILPSVEANVWLSSRQLCSPNKSDSSSNSAPQPPTDPRDGALQVCFAIE
jgi:hypothetical protein